MSQVTLPAAALESIGRARQSHIYAGGVLGRRPAVPTTWVELDRRARRRLTPKAYGYVAGGAGSESTMDADRSAFDRWRLVPRVLRDVSVRDTSVELFGRRLPAPLLLAPIGALGIVHREGDLAVARAAAAHGVPMIFSNQASVAMEQCAAAMGDAPRWFQLYWSTSDQLVASLVGRAERAGCSAIVVTLDTTMLGWRPRDLDRAYLPFAVGDGLAQYTSDPVFRRLAGTAPAGPAGPAGRPRLAELPAVLRSVARMMSSTARPPGRARAIVQTFLQTYSRPSLTWSDLPALRSLTSLPIVLKGIQRGDDARRALDAGVDGIIVSTHGGRQVDGARGALDSLPEVVAAVGGAVPVLMDSGIRGGADMLKAVALGARAVCVGRPYALALGLAGRRGVDEQLANLMAEFDLTLGLCGYRSVAELDPSVLERA
ncbi:alpha-hydroxy-acid oxidizing protein [Nakamurella sp.]|uniref:alpha-hydroxy-acid oxidizing protein n=1 Tax=Nakamurella sp. TaxID=1869182 RepID=UPI003782D6EC